MSGNSQTNWSRLAVALAVGVPTAGLVYYIYSRNVRGNTIKDDDGKSTTKNGSVRSTKSAQVFEENEPQGPLERALLLKSQGNNFYKAKQFQDAIRCYKESIDLCPPDAKEHLSALYQNIAAAYECLNNLEEVVKNCTEAVKLKPNYLKALLRRYKANERLGKLRAALEDVTACCILQEFKVNDEIASADRILIALGTEKAEEYLKTKKIVYPSSSFISHYLSSFSQDPISKYQTLNGDSTEEGALLTGLKAAKRALRDEKYEQVVNECTSEINLVKETAQMPSPDYYEALLLRGTMYILSNQEALAESDLNTIVNSKSEVDPKVVVSALLRRAGLRMQDGDILRAMEDFNECMNVDADNSDLYHQQAQMLLLSEKPDEAMIAFEKAEQLNPNFPLVKAQRLYTQYKLATVNNDARRAKQSVAEFEKLVAENPSLSEGCLLLAQVYNESGKYEKSEQIINEALKTNPSNATVLVHRGLLMLQWKGDISSGVSDLEKAIEIDPKCCFAYETLAPVEVQRGNLERAIELFDIAIDLTKSKKEAAHLWALREAANAQQIVITRLGIVPPPFSR